MARRCSYLPLLLPQIRRHFSRWIGRSSLGKLDLSTPWFTFMDRPLNWYELSSLFDLELISCRHYPIGLLHDIMVAENSSGSDGAPLLRPWTIQIHFQASSYPYDSILPFVDPDLSMTRSMYQEAAVSNPSSFSGDCTDAQFGGGTMSLQSYFYSSLKQAEYLRFGTCKRMMNLTKASQIQLWDALWTHNFERYWKVNEGLVKTPESSDLSKSNFVHRAPIRCYLIGDGTPVRIFQWPLRLEDATIETLSNQLRLGEAEQVHRVFLHGLELDPSTPLLWLTTNAAYADNFLHLVVHVSKKP